MCEYDSSKSLCVYASVFTSLSPTSLSLSLSHTLSLHPFSPSIFHTLSLKLAFICFYKSREKGERGMEKTVSKDYLLLTLNIITGGYGHVSG